ncbi:MAG: ferredoxin [Rhodobacterales bacterium]|nr:ferredoxin [Rhodobacterales bacterium]
MTYGAVEQAALVHHLEIFGGFYPKPADGLPHNVKTLLLFGPSEPGFWTYFTATPEYRDGGHDPMDRWSARVLEILSNDLGARAYFPFGGPPFQPFIAWARATGRAHTSPISMLVHDVAGLFVSYRGALTFDHILDLPATTTSPCDTCAGRPCTSACPVDALGAHYDVPACKSELERAGNACMDQGCAARRACPISQNYGRVAEQSAFHMEYFK